MNKYIDKYKTKINFNNILQSSEELIEIIKKVTEYYLDITFDNINFFDENSEQNESPDNNISEDNDKIELIDVEINCSNEIKFQEFFPKKIVKNKNHFVNLHQKAIKIQKAVMLIIVQFLY